MRLIPLIYDKLIRPQFLSKLYIGNVINKYFLIDGKTILDFGCGTGCNSFMFNPTNYIGFDIDYKRINYARHVYHNYTFITKNNGIIPISDKSIDIIFIYGVLHHLSDFQSHSTIKELKRMLRNNGSLIVIEPYCSKTTIVKNLILNIFDEGKYIRSKSGYENILDQELEIYLKKEINSIIFNNRILFAARYKSKQ